MIKDIEKAARVDGREQSSWTLTLTLTLTLILTLTLPLRIKAFSLLASSKLPQVNSLHNNSQRKQQKCVCVSGMPRLTRKLNQKFKAFFKEGKSLFQGLSSALKSMWTQFLLLLNIIHFQHNVPHISSLMLPWWSSLRSQRTAEGGKGKRSYSSSENTPDCRITHLYSALPVTNLTENPVYSPEPKDQGHSYPTLPL